MPPGSKELPSLDIILTLLEQPELWKLHEVVQNLFATPWSCNMCMVHMKPTLPPHYHPHPQAKATAMRTQSDIKKLPECGRSRRGRAGGALIDLYISKP